MQYVPFGKTGIEVSRLGFGCMRFPTTEIDGKQVADPEESGRMIRRAIELGVNYFDTAPKYCDGLSEGILGQALIGGLREKVYLSTKYPTETASGDDLEERLNHSLQNLRTDHIDFYHLWGINLDVYETKLDVADGPVSRALKMKEQGLIRHLSFSFHDKPENLIEILKRGNGIFDSVLCQYNVLDRGNEIGIQYAGEHGVGVTIMGPVGGGRLGAPSPVIQAMLPNQRASTPEIALRFVMNNPNVSIALSGMSSMAQVEENCAVASNMQPLSEDERRHIGAMLEENKRLADLYCTGCRYCMPCPRNIDIPKVFELMNYERVYQLKEYAREQYAQIGKNPWMQFENASACVGCGSCEKKCPQHLEIRKQLAQTHRVLTGETDEK